MTRTEERLGRAAAPGNSRGERGAVRGCRTPGAPAPPLRRRCLGDRGRGANCGCRNRSHRARWPRPGPARSDPQSSGAVPVTASASRIRGRPFHPARRLDDGAARLRLAGRQHRGDQLSDRPGALLPPSRPAGCAADIGDADSGRSSSPSIPSASGFSRRRPFSPSPAFRAFGAKHVARRRAAAPFALARGVRIGLAGRWRRRLRGSCRSRCRRLR